MLSFSKKKDFSKAFDTVPHDKLLHKMKRYGIQGRTMKVVVEGEESKSVKVESGVPKKTLLFIYFWEYLKELFSALSCFYVI